MRWKTIDRNTVDWVEASDPDPDYNCVGLVVSERMWWEPQSVPGVVDRTKYWPPDVPHEFSIRCYMAAVETRGFRDCEHGNWEDGFDKIVLCYSRSDDEFWHASLLVSPGVWKSKLGRYSNILHSFDQLDTNYCGGDGRIFMKRASVKLERPWEYKRPTPLQ